MRAKPFRTVTWPHFYGGSAVCKAVKFAQVLAPYLSSYTLVMTAVDRYQVSCTERGFYSDTCGEFFSGERFTKPKKCSFLMINDT